MKPVDAKGFFSRGYEPVVTVDPGETVVFSVLDAGWRWDPEIQEPTPEDAGHALYGPVEVRGARAGGTLLVPFEILSVLLLAALIAGIVIAFREPEVE